MQRPLDTSVPADSGELIGNGGYVAGRLSHAVVIAVLTAAITSTLAVAINLATELKSNSWAWLTVGLLTVLSAGISLYVSRAAGELAGKTDINKALTTLATTSERAWGQALSHRGLKADQLIKVPWHAAVYGLQRGDQDRRRQRIIRALRARGNSQQDRETFQDSINKTAAVVLREQARILILGPAGAGKSSFARWVAYACVRLRTEGDPVPVVLSISSWTAGEPIERWIERQLLVAHRSLTRKTGDDGISIARHLVAHRRVFPVLDGLDELPAKARVEFGEVLRDSPLFLEHSPLIITCRTAEKPEPTQAVPGLPLDTVLVMDPVEFDETVNALLKSASAYQEQSWKRVIEVCRINPTGPLAQTFSRPLMVAMATEVYHADLRNPERDPAELEHFSSRAAIENHILGSLIPTTMRRKRNSPDATGRRYRDKTLLTWLTFLAQHLDRHGTYDIRWWELRSSVSARGSLLAVAIASGLIVALASSFHFGLLRGILVGACVAVLTWLELERLRPPGQPQRLSPVNSVSLRRRVRDYRHRVRPGMLPRFIAGAAAGGALIWTLGAAVWVLAKIAPGFTRQALSGGGFFPNLLELDPILTLTLMSSLIATIFGTLLALTLDDEDITVLKTGLLDSPSSPFGVHQPVDFDEGANPRHTLGQDRRWSLLFLGCTAMSTIVSVNIGTAGSTSQVFPFIGWVNEHVVPWTVLSVVVLSLNVFLRAEWPWFIAARIPLTLGKRVPVRLVAFLDTMDSWDILRREGDIYRFRHATLRDWLLKRAAYDRYRSLDAEQQRLLRHLAPNPGPEFTADLVAHIDDISVFDAQRRLDQFRQATMMISNEDRYRWRAGCHAAVTELAGSDQAVEPPGLSEHVAQEIRLFYGNLLITHLADPPRSALPEDYRPLPLTPEGWRRLRADRHNVLACIRHGALRGDFGYTAEMTLLVVPYLRQWGILGEGRDLLDAILDMAVPPAVEMKLRYELARLIPDDRQAAITLLGRVLELARQTGDRGYEVFAQCKLASLREADDPQAALETALSATTLATQTDRSDYQALAQVCQGFLCLNRDPIAAQRLFSRGQELAQKVGNRALEADSLLGAGQSSLYQQNVPEAVLSLASSLHLYRHLGAFSSAAYTALVLAQLHHDCGQPAKAKPVVATAIRCARAASDEYLADAYYRQGEIDYALGDSPWASYSFLLAQQQFAKCGDRDQEVRALFALGCALIDAGESLIHQKRGGDWALTEGRTRLDEARKAFVELGDRRGEADALFELGRRAARGGDAKLWLTHAVTLYESLEDPAYRERIAQARHLLSQRTGE